MNILDIILIGAGLSMDALAITVANCTANGRTLTKKQFWAMPILFASFQGVMPLIGYFFGTLFFKYIEGYANYVVSTIFFLLALKVIIDIIKDISKKEDDPQPNATFGFGVILLQAFATSIDALVVGVTLVEAQISVFIAVTIIALVTFIIVTLGGVLGKKLGEVLGKYSNYVSAVILLILAIKNLF